jgi:hypothetical protein
MSNLTPQEFKRSVQSIFLKCGSVVLALVVAIALIYTYADAVGEAIVAMCHWSVSAVIWLKDVLWARIRLHDWLPFGFAATMLVVKLWLSCVCSSMVKQGLRYSPLYAKLDTANKRMRLVSILSLCVYAPFAAVPLIVFIATFVYAMCLLVVFVEKNTLR